MQVLFNVSEPLGDALQVNDRVAGAGGSVGEAPDVTADTRRVRSSAPTIAIPLCVKFMFDFLDQLAGRNRISHEAVLHSWKSNWYFLYFIVYFMFIYMLYSLFVHVVVCLFLTLHVLKIQ